MKLRSDRADGDGVRAIPGWVGVTLVRPSYMEDEDGDVPAVMGECAEYGECGDDESAESGGVFAEPSCDPYERVMRSYAKLKLTIRDR